MCIADGVHLQASAVLNAFLAALRCRFMRPFQPIGTVLVGKTCRQQCHCSAALSERLTLAVGREVAETQENNAMFYLRHDFRSVHPVDTVTNMIIMTAAMLTC